METLVHFSTVAYLCFLSVMMFAVMGWMSFSVFNKAKAEAYEIAFRTTYDRVLISGVCLNAGIFFMGMAYTLAIGLF